VPLLSLRAAAGFFSDPQNVEPEGWVRLDAGRRLRHGMFVARITGKSMEPRLPDGAFALFSGPVAGTRQGKIVLVQLRDAVDPESGERYTVKRYESEKNVTDDGWRHTKIVLHPVSPDFEPILLKVEQEEQLRVVAELLEVLA
jgi:SOS-response transcriptional repressor LexA